MGACEEKGGSKPAPSTMRRELSVEDLFVPFSSLDVRLHSSSASGHPIAVGIESTSPRVNLLGTSVIEDSQMPGLGGMASTRFQSPSFTQLDPSRYLAVSIPRNSTVSCSVQKWGMDTPEEGNAAGLYAMDAQTYPSVLNERDRTLFDQEGKSPVIQSPRTEPLHSPISRGNAAPRGSGSGQDAAHQLPNSSNSDEDQLVMDDRKQRRMLSNRESARRSRLRKQQHLDDLRTYVAQLRAENSQMTNRFNAASQRYAQLTEENRILWTQVVELSHQLQRLNHTAASQYPNLIQTAGHDSARKPPGLSMRGEARHLPPLSQPVVSASLH